MDTISFRTDISPVKLIKLVDKNVRDFFPAKNSLKLDYHMPEVYEPFQIYLS